MTVNDIKTVAVIGAGDMGHGIAEVALIAGCRVVLRDIKQEYVERGAMRIDESLRKLVQKGRVSQEHHNLIRSELFKTCTDLPEAVFQADLVIEAIPEDLLLKKQLFEQLDVAAPAHAILASNTSTMSITQLAKATLRPAQVVGMHFFNPAVLMKTVEIVKGDSTSDKTMDLCFVYCEKIGKKPVRVNKDVPGFIINRVQAPTGVLVNSILDEGIATPEELDALLRGQGMPMGPCELMDYTGLDINFSASKYFADTVHRDYAPGKVLSEKVQAGELGKKSGKGFFNWSQGRPSIDLTKATQKIDPGDFALVNANEATRLIEMGVCSAEDIDTAVLNGTGSPVGPMAVLRGIGPQEATQRLEGLAARFGKSIFQPSDTIRSGKC
ncbi:MAG: 3-hydroxyacyl-CoA dehydrogenase NAD-binding domain-containing protein [Candidatus Hydrogenedentales bacterium]